MHVALDATVKVHVLYGGGGGGGGGGGHVVQTAAIGNCAPSHSDALIELVTEQL